MAQEKANHVAVQPKIRWMIRRDLPRVVEIETDVFDADRWDEKEILACLKQRNCIAKVIEVNEQVEGYLFYELEKMAVNIVNIAVHPDWRRRGLGTMLLEALKSSAGYRKPIVVLLRESSLGVQLFLRSNGFRAVRIYRGIYDDVGEDGYEFRFSRECQEQLEILES